jgi:ribosomal protein S18 acetylase RimI-like enzyme
MDGRVRYREAEPGDFEAMIELSRALPAFFNEQGLAEMSVDLPNQLGVVAEIDAVIVGFVTWYAAGGFGRIGWIAVSGDHHRSGIGARLLERVEHHLGATGATRVEVDTLGESVDYEPYNRTRAFYRAMGYRDLRSVNLDNPGMPEMLTLEKRLGGD